jgi:hypothetical protein
MISREYKVCMAVRGWYDIYNNFVMPKYIIMFKFTFTNKYV